MTTNPFPQMKPLVHFLTIHFFLKLIAKMGLWSFAVYRIIIALLIIGFMFKSQKYVDVDLASTMSEENASDVVRILQRQGYRQSRIGGQWVK